MNIQNRIMEEAEYILKTKETIRELAKVFGVSKSTVHKDLSERIKKINYQKYLEVKDVLDYHIQIRHIRGGESTRNKYLTR